MDLSHWVFVLLLVSVFNLGVYGVWYAMYIDWAVRIVAFQLRYFSGKWKTKRIIWTLGLCWLKQPVCRLNKRRTGCFVVAAVKQRGPARFCHST